MHLSPSEIADRCRNVRTRMEVAAVRAGRSPTDVTLIVVSKTFGVEAIRAALDAGARDVGENYLQEAVPKIETLRAEDRTVRWHFIGHLQRNKAARVASLFDVVQTVDSLALAERLQRTAEGRGRVVTALIEVNLGREKAKSGVSLDDLPQLVRSTSALTHVRVEGLMTVPPIARNAEESRSFFRSLAQARHDLRARGFDLPHLSMGMTDDYEIAIEEGATLVRVGRAIFGERSKK